MSQPEITNKQLTPNRIGFKIALFLTVAFCIVSVSVAFFILSMVKPYMGVDLSLISGKWEVESVDSNGAAYHAGIKVGDIPLEINGQPAQTFLSQYQKAGNVLSTLVDDLRVVDEIGQTKTASLMNSSPSLQSVLEAAAWFVVSIVFWGVGFYVFIKRPRNLAALILCVCGLAFGLALGGTQAASRSIPTALVFAVTAPILSTWLLLHFFLILPEERTRLRNSPLTYLVYLPPVITLILFFLVGYADGQPVQWFRSVRILEYGVAFLAVVGVAIFNYFSTSYARTRQQMRIVLASCLVALVPPVILYILPQAVWGQPILPSTISVLFIAFIPIGMGYAVVTQKLMDIDVIIRRGVVYGLVTLMMATILSAAIFPIFAFRTFVGIPEAILIALVLGGVSTLLFGPAKKGAENLVDRIFYKDRYDYRQIIQTVSSALNLVNDFYEASRLIVGTTVRTLNLTGSALFIRVQSGSFELGAAQGTYTDENKQIALLALISHRDRMLEFPNSASSVSPDLAFLIPLIAGDKEVGILCVSQKVTRQTFSSDDLFLLQGMASITAMALHSALLIRDVSLRDTFVSVASHELRTPLTSILGYADLLLRRNPPEDTRKRWLQNILDSAQRISAMVDDLLNVTRIQSGKTSIKLNKINVSQLLEETLSLTKDTNKGHEFVTNIELDLPEIIVDRDKFGQVIGNLLSNAVKYSPGGGQVTLSAFRDRQKHQIVVSIADHGIGIGPDDRDSLFTTFHRIQRPETQGIKGSGLGLYIAKEWTEAMGGNIWLESELNKGSTFFVGIPEKDFELAT